MRLKIPNLPIDFYWKWLSAVSHGPGLVPLAHDGVTEAGYAWQGEDVAHDWDTAEEVDGHGKESSE